MELAIRQTDNPLSKPNLRPLRLRLERLSARMMDRRYAMEPTRAMILARDSEVEVRGMLRALREHHRPATVREIQAVYDGWVRDFPQAAAPGEAEGQRFLQFCTDIAGLPVWALKDADRRYRTEPSKDGRQKFFPQAWQILVLCDDERVDAIRMTTGCERMIAALESPCPTKPGETPVSTDTMREGLEKLNRLFKTKQPAPAPDHFPDVEKMVAVKNTGREKTDAAELKAALARKVGTAA